MPLSDCLQFSIMDIVRIKRGQAQTSTKNKECYVLSCRIDGSAVFHTEQGDLSVSTGDILYIPKNATYTQQTASEEVIYLHLDISGNTEKNVQIIKTPNPDKICNAFCELERIWSSKCENYAYLCTARLYNLIAETGIALPKKSETILSPALQYMNEHFSKPDFSIQTACDKCNISRVYFNRLFKKEMKMTPVDYINRQKIKAAEFLLTSGNYKHEEIATLCGFSDVKYFYVVLKKLTGKTTKDYKNKNAQLL